MNSNRNHNILYLVAGAYIGYLGIKIWKGVVTGEATSNPILLGIFATLFIAAAFYLLFISGKYFLTHKEDDGDTAQMEEEDDDTAQTEEESDEPALPDGESGEPALPDGESDEAVRTDMDGDSTSLPDTDEDSERP